MKLLRTILVTSAAAACSLGFAQSWRSAYEDGLTSARALNWAAARKSFQQAAAYRPEDVSGPTTLPGSITERKQWRNGAPYSPNFLAAYALYRRGAAETGDSKKADLTQSLAEFDTLLKKGQISRESLYFATVVAGALGDAARRDDYSRRLETAKTDWKVDTEVVAPEELAQIPQSGGVLSVVSPTPTGQAPVIKPTDVGGPILNPTPGGAVPTVSTKFALLIGNSEAHVKDLGVPFASDDVQAVRRSLVNDAGYSDSNIDLVVNATADQIAKSVAALAARVPDGATVLVYFAGAGVNIEGKDYLVGVEAEDLTSISSLIAKTSVYQPFVTKGAKVFAFFEVNRPVTDGRFFGMEVPMVGAIAQTEATAPGDMIGATVVDGKLTGVYTGAFCGALADLHVNNVPISEFGWQVFYKTRKGGGGTEAGGARQTPTLPVLINLASDARF